MENQKKYNYWQIKVEKNDLSQYIINSYENMKSEEYNWIWGNIDAKRNEKEIINSEIFINDKKIHKIFALILILFQRKEFILLNIYLKSH